MSQRRVTWPTIPEAAWTRAFDAPTDVGHSAKVAGQFDGGCEQGVPLGGIGAGGIGRAWTGVFRRWTLKPGTLKHFVESANGFALFHQVVGEMPSAVPLQPRPESGNLSAWAWSDTPPAGAYAGLFPKAWFRYAATPERPVELVCEQFSPILPHRYEEAALPVAVFRWHVRNTGGRPVKIGLLFSWANMNGWFDDYGHWRPERRSGGNINRPLEVALEGGTARGILLDRVRDGDVPPESVGQWAIAALQTDRVAVRRTVSFSAAGDGKAIWESFAATGSVPEDDSAWIASAGFVKLEDHTVAGGLSATAILAPGESGVIPMALAWDLPVTQFGGGRRHWRRYTREVGRDGRQAAGLVRTALNNAADWSQDIDDWHGEHAAAHGYPLWLDRMLFNELYLLIDGYTVWTDGPVEPDGPARPYFGIIECPDYPVYSTMDLWVYGSFALLQHWPELERQVIRDYARCVTEPDERLRRTPWTATRFPIGQFGAVPHDLGAPAEDPGVLVNAYTFQDPANWKDLPAQFVLTAGRDVLLLDDDALLDDCWPAICAAMDWLATFDRDGDGLIENEGTDQTFDCVPMRGPTAYCGGLWLAALEVAAVLAERRGNNERSVQWHEQRVRAADAFEHRLWTGRYYRLDTDSEYADAVFIEQCFGPWYAKRSGVDDVVPAERVRTALQTVYAENFLGLERGRFGVLNITGFRDAIRAGGLGHAEGYQSDEVLTGINLSFANQLWHYGMTDEAQRVLKSIHDAIYVERGLWFRTAAAYDPEATTFRAIMNLRPLVIWALPALGSRR